MSRPRLFNPDGNARLTATVGLILIVLSLAEIATLLLGLGSMLHLHVIIGLVLLPPIVLKLASTGWRFARYYTRNEAYLLKGAPQILMRLMAPLLIAFTVLLFGSGVAMGFVHGEALRVARQIHGPASVGWMIALGLHVLVYLRRALHDSAADARARTRGEVAGRRLRALAVAGALLAGLAVGLATLPVQHNWLHLHSRHHDRREGATRRAETPTAPRAR